MSSGTSSSRQVPAGPQDGADLHARLVMTPRQALAGGPLRVALQVPRWEDDGGVAFVRRKLTLRLPFGWRAGQLLHIPGRGGPGRANGRAGDLYLELCIASDGGFAVHGADLHADLDVDAGQAARGARVPRALPDGRTVAVDVPAGTRSGDRLRLVGLGLAGPVPGDLVLRACVRAEPADAGAGEPAG